MTADEARQLAEFYQSLGAAVQDYRLAKINELSDEESRALVQAEGELLDASSSMLGLAGRLTLDELEETLQRISGATAQMKDAIHSLQAVKKVIGVATAAVALGGALVTGNPVAIVAAVNNVAEAAG